MPRLIQLLAIILLTMLGFSQVAEAQVSSRDVKAIQNEVIADIASLQSVWKHPDGETGIKNVIDVSVDCDVVKILVHADDADPNQKKVIEFPPDQVLLAFDESEPAGPVWSCREETKCVKLTGIDVKFDGEDILRLTKMYLVGTKAQTDRLYLHYTALQKLCALQ